MESENNNHAESQELNQSMTKYYEEIEDIINKKFEVFRQKLDKKREELEIQLKSKLLDVSKMNSEIKEREKFIENSTDKKELGEEAKLLKSQVDDLIDKLESINKLSDNIKNKILSELLNIENDEFVLLNVDKDYGAKNLSESPANSFRSDRCRQCKATLKWGGSYLSQSCGFSDNCNTHYRYGCHSCNIRFCTKCAYPPNVDICGCGETMTYKSAAYHNCDLCRKTINSRCWRCSNCDFDICDACYAKLKNK